MEPLRSTSGSQAPDSTDSLSDELVRRRQHDAARKRRERAVETEAQSAERRKRDGEHSQQRRNEETPQERCERNAKARERSRKRRAQETPEERRERNCKAKEQRKARKAASIATASVAAEDHALELPESGCPGDEAEPQEARSTERLRQVARARQSAYRHELSIE